MIQPVSSQNVDLVINRISKEDFYALSASGGISGDLSNQLWMTPGSADSRGSDISVHPVLTSGVHIATLSVDDVETKLYAPNSPGPATDTESGTIKYKILDTDEPSQMTESDVFYFVKEN